MQLYEITGAGTKNKGAFLMLKTVIRRLSDGASPDLRFGVDPSHAGDFYLRSLEGLYQFAPSWHGTFTFNNRLKTIKSQIAAALIPNRYRLALGLLSRKESRGLIDIAGLRYGESFHIRSIYNAISLIDGFYPRRRAPVVFFSQMVGPFPGR